MNKKKITKAEHRKRRQTRVRAKIFGTAKIPRVSVYRSLTGMFAQIIDDLNSKTLISMHSKKVDLKGDVGERKGKVAKAYLLGRALAEKAKATGIEQVVFDRAGNKYHGRVQALAEGARDGGLKF